MHKILLEENTKTSIEHQRKLNLVMKEVVRKEVLKWLNVGLIYAILDSPWVSLVHVVSKKGGFTIIRNEKNDLIPTRTVTGWRVCIDYKKLNTTTRKDHYPFPFTDQMLPFTTFTCPYSTFTFRRMLFGLCNALATF